MKRVIGLAALQARVAHLYRLSADEFAHVLASFPLIDAAQREMARQAFDASAL